MLWSSWYLPTYSTTVCEEKKLPPEDPFKDLDDCQVSSVGKSSSVFEIIPLNEFM